MTEVEWWLCQPEELVSIWAIRPTKLTPPWWKLAKVLLVMAHVLKPRSGDYLPHLVQSNPAILSYEIEDGHHRISVLSLAGKKFIRARVLRPNTLHPEPQEEAT